MPHAVPLLLLFGSPTAWAAGGGGQAVEMSPLLVLPFAGMLLSIAVLPMVAHHWWENNRNQFLVSLGWATPILAYLGYLILNGDPGHVASHGLAHAIEEYVSFIALLGSLFIISGGILMKGDLEGTPTTNTAFLTVGDPSRSAITTSPTPLSRRFWAWAWPWLP